ncbi:hypothetical protein FN846DRAFT_474206 [Sphaerosporella brunnea]|uniref:F-box domain-containing protein n=1 Tax=Sphaerosporella brunnea TaxID=1250544 RepID=A0A5J5EER7_9PEZI|nr:hypothetical protein FN846DRAFT_474206 [Sphaerosporella brunnea]
MASYTPYHEDTPAVPQMCTWAHTEDWNPAGLTRPGLRGVCFQLAFEARDAHLQTITTLPALCNALTAVAVLDSSRLTDAGISDLVTCCPELKVLSLRGASKLTNASLHVALTKLSKLELLRIAGCSAASRSGKLKTKGSITLLLRGSGESGGSNGVARGLKKLDLTGQDGLSFAACMRLSGEREGLEVVVGSTAAYTYWKGAIVKVERNPVLGGGYMGGPGESGIAEEEEGEDGESDWEEEEYSDPEDETKTQPPSTPSRPAG